MGLRALVGSRASVVKHVSFNILYKAKLALDYLRILIESSFIVILAIKSHYKL